MRVDKKYLVFGDYSHEFTVDIKNGKKDTFVLKRSNNPEWTNPGEKIMKAVDNGNKITINGVDYDYSDFEELYSLMTVIKESQKKLWYKTKVLRDVNHKQA